MSYINSDDTTYQPCENMSPLAPELAPKSCLICEGALEPAASVIPTMDADCQITPITVALIDLLDASVNGPDSPTQTACEHDRDRPKHKRGADVARPIHGKQDDVTGFGITDAPGDDPIRPPPLSDMPYRVQQRELTTWMTVALAEYGRPVRMIHEGVHEEAELLGQLCCPVEFRGWALRGRRECLRTDGIMHGNATSGGELRDYVAERLTARERSLGWLASAIAGGPSWLTVDVLMSWTLGYETPTSLARDPALPSDKTISAALATAAAAPGEGASKVSTTTLFGQPTPRLAAKAKARQAIASDEYETRRVSSAADALLRCATELKYRKEFKTDHRRAELTTEAAYHSAFRTMVDCPKNPVSHGIHNETLDSATDAWAKTAGHCIPSTTLRR